MKPKTIDEILDKFRLHCDMAWSEVSDGVYTSKDFHETAYPRIKSETKAQIQQLLEECAPIKRTVIKDESLTSAGEQVRYRSLGFNQAIDQYKSNIMEKLR